MRGSHRSKVSIAPVLAAAIVAGCGDAPTHAAVDSRVEVGIEQSENTVLINPFTTHVQVGDSVVLRARTVQDGRGIPLAAPTWRVNNVNVTLRTLDRAAGGDWIRVAAIATGVGNTTAIASYQQFADTIELAVVPRRPAGN